MLLSKLKENIKNNTIDSTPIIFSYTEMNSKFICYQYIKAITSLKKLTICFIQDLKDIPQSSFMTEDDSLYVLDVEEIKDIDLKGVSNLVVVAKKLPDNMKDLITVVPKVQEWQIHDYIKKELPGLEEKKITWFQKVCKNDIYRIDVECKRLSIFDKKDQEKVFNELYEDNIYKDLTSLTIFDLTNAIIKRNKALASSILANYDFIDIQGPGIGVILNKQFFNILNIQCDPKATAESLGISFKQFQAIKYNNVGRYKEDQLRSMLKFLSNIDYDIKSGRLDISDRQFVSYVVTKMFVLGE